MAILPGVIHRRLALRVRRGHVAVQLDPELRWMKDIEGAKQYLIEYFGEEANIDIYWGSPEEFLVALYEELQAAGDLSVEPEEDDDDDDEWTF